MGIIKKDLSADEERLTIQKPISAINVYTNTNLANEYTENYFGDDYDTTKGNAFKHAMWQALNTRSNGPVVAIMIACAHENKVGQDTLTKYEPKINANGDKIKTTLYDATAMDLYNNAVGIAIGTVADRNLSNDELASLVHEVVVTEGQGRWIYP